MKALFSFLLALCLSPVLAQAQITATDFTATDCNGNQHNLFDQLDSDKVVIIAWVMPCSACVGPADEAYKQFQTFQGTHPGRVLYYVVDDYANSSCTDLKNWASSIGVTNPTALFSSLDITMSDYGTDGMPKVVVLANATHRVLFNENDMEANDSAGIAAAITHGLNNTSGIREEKAASFRLYPNPVSDKLYIQSEEALENIFIYNSLGVEIAFPGVIQLTETYSELPVNTLPAGIYYLRSGRGMQKFQVLR